MNKKWMAVTLITIALAAGIGYGGWAYLSAGRVVIAGTVEVRPVKADTPTAPVPTKLTTFERGQLLTNCYQVPAVNSGNYFEPRASRDPDIEIRRLLIADCVRRVDGLP